MSDLPRATGRRLLVLVIGCLVLSGSAAAIASATSLPTCRIDDVKTAQRGYDDWRRTVLDPTYRLTKGYAPTDLRSTSHAGLNGGQKVRALVIADLRDMATAARQAGARLAVQSAYRSYSTQKATFSYWVRVLGKAEALRTSARAGHSEHQLGTTIDFRALWRAGPLGQEGLGQDRRSGSGSGTTPGIRLHHVLPERHERGHVLQLRALALPVRRARQGCRGAWPATSCCANICGGNSRPRRPLRVRHRLRNRLRPQRRHPHRNRRPRRVSSLLACNSGSMADMPEAWRPRIRACPRQG